MTSLPYRYRQPLVWGLLHCVNDFTAGYMLAAYTYNHTADAGFLLIVVYAIIGFGGQLPAGFWLDYLKRLRPFVLASFVLLPLSVIAYWLYPAAGIVLAGFASAVVHVTGGAVCLQGNSQKTGPLALFTAPGVLGLAIGGLLGHADSILLAASLGTTVLLAAWAYRQPLPVYQRPEQPQSQLDTHDWLMLGILLVMCFRSFLFDVVNHLAQDYSNGIVIVGISAFAGKIVGGFLADRIGWKKYLYISLPLALLLFQFGQHNIYALAFGIACLQSSVPITLLLMARSLPLYPATATALSLGTSVALAGLPLYMVGSKTMVINWFHTGWISVGFYILLLGSAVLVIQRWYRQLPAPADRQD